MSEVVQVGNSKGGEENMAEGQIGKAQRVFFFLALKIHDMILK